METRLPESLLEAVRYFSDPDTCHNFAVSMRWPEGVTCPRCGCGNVGFVATRRIWNCKGCKKQFSFKVGTVLEDSPLGLDKWFVALWMLAGAKNGISSHELSRALGVTQKTAWFLLHRGRLILQTGSFEKMQGTVEVDESYIGGLEKNKHSDKKQNAGRGTVGKQIVLGILQRGDEKEGISQVSAKVIPNTEQATLHGEIESTVETGSEVMTDAHRSYRGLEENYRHEFVDHAVQYAEGRVYTNGIENFWNLFDRTMHGTYTYCLPHNLNRYLDEQAYRFNHRDGTDLTRFLIAMQQISGKRLTYEELTWGHLQTLMPKK